MTTDSCTGSLLGSKEPEAVIKAIDVSKEEGDETTEDGALNRTNQQPVINHTRGYESSLSPVVEELRTLIEDDPLLYRLFTRMFQEVPRHPPFDRDPCGNSQIRDYKAMLQRLDDVLIRAPDFDETIMAGCPINALLAWTMATPSGIAAFLHEKVNVQLRKILHTWAVFLSSPASTHVLSDHPERGWLGTNALKLMPNFAADYVCNPGEPHYGFKSWDNFFTRKLREGVRPVDHAKNLTVIVNACESTAFCLAYGVKAHDRFWIKDQFYSLVDMLADDSLSPRFYGGTVFQAYLGCTNYHRWHSKVFLCLRRQM
ncbi:MAG: hypothetical protein Q9166_007511 [cf. Caloplaca sp. 2 TL-2023]